MSTQPTSEVFPHGVAFLMLHFAGSEQKCCTEMEGKQSSLLLLLLNDKRRHREKEENNIIDKSCLWKKKAIMYNQAESLSW